MLRKAAFCCGLLLGPALAVPAVALEIQLTVEEPAGASRTDEPVTSGVPLPAGTQTSNWSLWDGGSQIPLQVTTLDGRTPWILLDFQLDLGSGNTKTLTLKDTPAAAPSTPIEIDEDASEILVRTGPLQVRVKKNPYDLVDAVWLDEDGNGSFSAGEQLFTSGADNMLLVDATSGQTFSGRGTPDSIEWEYVGPLRSVLRVDGAISNGQSGDFLNFTTRFTFFAGRTEFEIEHVIRNSIQPNERTVKIQSATIKLGGGGATARVENTGYRSWINAGAAGAKLELIPPTLRNGTLNVDQNGGMLLLDLAYHGGTMVVDFAQGLGNGEKDRREKAARSRLFALAPAGWYSEHGELAVSQFGTLQDEKNAYNEWGWSWSADQEPDLAHDEDYFVNCRLVDIHGESESDDLWQNSIMYLRTGERGYLDRTLSWGRYYKWEMAFRTDGFDFAWDGVGEWPKVQRPEITIPLTAGDNSYEGECKSGRADNRRYKTHVWGWGLGNYYHLTGDREAVTALVDLAELSERTHGWETPGDPERSPGAGNSLRGPARHWMIAMRAWELTQDNRWRTLMDHILQLWLQSTTWEDIGPQAGSYLGSKDYAPRAVRVMQWGNMNLAHHRYWQLTGNAAIRTRLLKLAHFALQYGLDDHDGSYPGNNHSNLDSQYSGSWMALDYPSPGDYWHVNFDEPTGTFDPAPTMMWIDALAQGYEITNDDTFLARAKLHWDRYSKVRSGWPPDRIYGNSQVGRFVNNNIDTHHYARNGELTYVHLFFHYATNAPGEIDPPTDPPPAPTGLAVN